MPASYTARMQLTTSFTRGTRFPAPDVARGCMLLLIAVANVPVWAAGALSMQELFPDYARMSTADSVWIFMRTLLVDHRVYPLFAMLFGFGLMTMINRRIASGTHVYLASLTDGRVELASPLQEAWAREQATIDARRLVRRRGWWMILIGAIHAVFFVGDIIGTYGLIAVIFAGWLARKHRKRMLAAGIGFLVLTAVSMLGVGWMAASQAMQQATAEAANSGFGSLQIQPGNITNLFMWVGTTLATVLLSVAVPAVLIGARLADTDLLTHPERHRGLLWGIGVGGLTLGALGSFHNALFNTGMAALAPTDAVSSELTGLFGACGWLALMALYAGGPRPDGELTGMRWVASAVGRRSMTAYLSQTILFALIFAVVPWLLGTSLRPGDAVAAVIAVGVWLVTVVLCVALERAGRAGPFETLLRTWVARSAKQRRVPPAPMPPPMYPGPGPLPA